ncbi:uncharacterized protein LOC143204026 [Rhynchophorus ferrugineus]|uniref:uncharacterized protein LOC143204026 n=1 Tax=Rhynchophorus ferrugineus TaxID=354439 RepID=UPI003FCC9ED0
MAAPTCRKYWHAVKLSFWCRGKSGLVRSKEQGEDIQSVRQECCSLQSINQTKNKTFGLQDVNMLGILIETETTGISQSELLRISNLQKEIKRATNIKTELITILVFTVKT